ncbi:MAG: tetraacyldisaccharide 4'-kinase [Bacteroidetes bacterium]|nr:tetraacyldisaccharide 4'-kinase [Bacteroidota bacterium]
MILLRLLLFPFGLIYGLIGWLRNKAFDSGIFSSQSFPVAVISVGNLNMGGTGKTPHIEYLIRLLKEDYKVATLSRGYRRKTRGFLLADPGSTAETIGDEPLQYRRKFEDIPVAVCENRKEGIRRLLAQYPDLDVILLDDAFQHRSVKSGISIVLTDYHKPYTQDYIFPVGMLREFRSGAKRSDIVIKTKTPKIFSPITRRSLEEDIKPAPHQQLFFSYLTYGMPVPLFEKEDSPCKSSYNTVLMVTGIANPDPLEIYLKESDFFNELEKMIFPDHHLFTLKDAGTISKTFHNIVTRNKVMITTEKDAMRLRDSSLATLLDSVHAFYLPIEVEFHKQDKLIFDQQMLDYVRKNKKNR